MKFDEIFMEVNSKQEKEIKAEIKSFFSGDKTYMMLKKRAKKNQDAVPDFLDYVYTSYEKQIEKISKKYKMDYDEIAQLFISM